MREEIWDKSLGSIKKDITFLPLNLGIKVFEVVGCDRKTDTKSNDYKKATPNYIETSNKEIGCVERYLTRNMKIKLLHYNNQPYKDMIVNTTISEKVFRRIVITRHSIKEMGLIPPPYLLYYKRNKLTVEYAFVTKEEYDRVKKYIIDKDYDRLSYEICFSGAKVKYDKKKFIRYYKRLQE